MKVRYARHVLEIDIPSLNKEMALRIKNAIEKRLMVAPLEYGDYLHGTLKGNRKYRVGDHRIVYRVIGNDIYILAIGKRKDDEVYQVAAKRSRTQIMEKSARYKLLNRKKRGIVCKKSV
jgi:mRNA interferase RelE/StbE